MVLALEIAGVSKLIIGNCTLYRTVNGWVSTSPLFFPHGPEVTDNVIKGYLVSRAGVIDTYWDGISAPIRYECAGFTKIDQKVDPLVEGQTVPRVHLSCGKHEVKLLVAW